jgi:hypothetical protein
MADERPPLTEPGPFLPRPAENGDLHRGCFHSRLSFVGKRATA